MPRQERILALITLGAIAVVAGLLLTGSAIVAHEQASEQEQWTVTLAEAFQNRLEQFATTTRHGYPSQIELTDVLRCVPPYRDVPVNMFSGRPISAESTDPGDFLYVYRGPSDYRIYVFGAGGAIIRQLAPEQPPIRQN